MTFDGKIYITSTGVMITPYHRYQSHNLERLTSTYDNVSHSRDELTGYFIDVNKEQMFLTHLHSPVMLQQEFPRYEIVYMPKKRGRKLNHSFSLNVDITPSEVQYQIINDVIQNKMKHQWFVYLSQGLGKTLLSVYLASCFQVKTLIMCFSVDILKQWMQTFKLKTTLDLSRVLLIDSSELLKKINSGEFPVNDYDIFLCTPALLVRYGKRNKYSNIPKVLDAMGIGFKIFDEAHRNIGNIIKINAMTSIDKTLYLSGDFGQSAKDKEDLYFRIFYNVPIITPSEDLMNNLKFTVAIVIEYNSEPSELDKLSVYRKRGFSFYDYMKYQFRTETFFDVLDYTLSQIDKSNINGFKTLILVNLIDHVEILYSKLQDKYGNSKIIGRYHSNTSDEDKDISREYANIIVSTYQSFSTGIDVKDIKFVISTSICTKIDDNQASGRARPLSDGSDAYYFMFSDIGFSYTGKKLRERISYLQETKIKNVIKLKYV